MRKMELTPFRNFGEFVDRVHTAGFLPGALDCEGAAFSVGDLCGEGVVWHTGDDDHDPWQYRIRVLSETEDIAYGKFFSKKSGYITRDWMPRFIAARRRAYSFDEMWQAGRMSRCAKKVYDLLRETPVLATHDIRSLGNFAGEKKSALESALAELQMSMFITVCGEAQKISAEGEPYGWPGSIFCTVENFFAGVEEEAGGIDPARAADEISDNVREFAPNVSPRALKALIAQYI